MRLDPSYLHFMSREELRVLAAVELGMRNHQYVPSQLIVRFANLKGGQGFKTLRRVLKNKFVTHVGGKNEGYRLTFLGYDYLALHTLMKRGLIKDVLGKIGVGKESDIYKCVTEEGEYVALKLTRLGRNSFRSIKKNRQYIQGRTNYNWLYLSRLSSIRQFLFMQLLHREGFPTPKPIDTNRHAILMSLVDGDTLCHVIKVHTQKEVRSLFEKTLEVVTRLAKNGLIHGDYNEFNLMVSGDGQNLTVIDFPQCVSVKHPNASTYFSRDVECIFKYFHRLGEKSFQEAKKSPEQGALPQKQFDVSQYAMPILDEIEIERRLDHEIKKLGHFSLQEFKELDGYRGEVQRIRREMDALQQQEQEEEIEIGEDSAENEEKLEEGNQVDQLQFEQGFDKIELVEGHHEGNKYDEQLQKLLNGMDQVEINDHPEAQHQDEDSSSSEEERFKGLTPYEIRMKIKEEKRIQREKKKQAVNTDDYIKKALRRGGGRRSNLGRGNHGNKAKVKEANLQIKDQMW